MALRPALAAHGGGEPPKRQPRAVARSRVALRPALAAPRPKIAAHAVAPGALAGSWFLRVRVIGLGLGLGLGLALALGSGLGFGLGFGFGFGFGFNRVRVKG